MDDDEVVDYLIMEAVATKAAKEDEKIQEKHKVDNWRKEQGKELNKFRG